MKVQKYSRRALALTVAISLISSELAAARVVRIVSNVTNLPLSAFGEPAPGPAGVAGERWPRLGVGELYFRNIPGGSDFLDAAAALPSTSARAYVFVFSGDRQWQRLVLTAATAVRATDTSSDIILLHAEPLHTDIASALVGVHVHPLQIPPALVAVGDSVFNTPDRCGAIKSCWLKFLVWGLVRYGGQGPVRPAAAIAAAALAAEQLPKTGPRAAASRSPTRAAKRSESRTRGPTGEPLREPPQWGGPGSVMFLDADVLVLRPMTPAFAAFEARDLPGPYDVGAVPDLIHIFVSPNEWESDLWNTGVFVARPSADVLGELWRFSASAASLPPGQSAWFGADTWPFNSFFSGAAGSTGSGAAAAAAAAALGSSAAFDADDGSDAPTIRGALPLELLSPRERSLLEADGGAPRRGRGRWLRLPQSFNAYPHVHEAMTRLYGDHARTAEPLDRGLHRLRALHFVWPSKALWAAPDCGAATAANPEMFLCADCCTAFHKVRVAADQAILAAQEHLGLVPR